MARIRPRCPASNSSLLQPPSIIPTSMRAEMRKSLHTGHIGFEKTKARARETMFWPNINGELEDMIKCCSTCQEHQNRQSSEPPIPHDIPDAPWQKVATDLLSLRNKDYVIVADYTSKFFNLPNSKIQRLLQLLFTPSVYSPNSVLQKKFLRQWSTIHFTQIQQICT